MTEQVFATYSITTDVIANRPAAPSTAGGRLIVYQATDVGLISFYGGTSIGWLDIPLMRPPKQKITPATGFSQTINNNVDQLIIVPAGTLATGTVTMPAAPYDNQLVGLCSTQTITALTMAGNTGQTLLGALTTISASGFATWQWVAADTTWYRVA